MKKLITILAAVMLTAALTGTAIASEAGDLAGTWYLATMVQDGMEVDASVVASMGMNITVTLNEDGTAIMDMSGSATEGTWTPDGGLQVEENPIPLQLVDGNLVIEQGNVKMVLSKEPPEIKTFTLAPAVENPQLGDFNGTWKSTLYQFMGISMPIKLAGTEFSFTIQDGSVKYSETTYDMENNFAVLDTIEKEFSAKQAEDGTLFIDFAGEEVLSKLSPGCSGINLTLRQDGVLTGTIPELEEQMAQLAAMSAESATAENAEAEAPGTDVQPAEGDSAGSSGGSSGADLSVFFVFEKAE